MQLMEKKHYNGMTKIKILIEIRIFKIRIK